MTGIIAGAYTTFARVAIDSYFGTAAGDDSTRGLKLFVLPHVRPFSPAAVAWICSGRSSRMSAK
jgi:hypothetical protein